MYENMIDHLQSYLDNKRVEFVIYNGDTCHSISVSCEHRFILFPQSFSAQQCAERLPSYLERKILSGPKVELHLDDSRMWFYAVMIRY